MTDRIDEQEEVRVVEDADGVREVRIKEDHVAEQREYATLAARLVWILVSALEFLLGLRVFLKAIAANPNNAFASIIYGFSELFVWPFNGLTGTPSVDGFVLDVPAIIAMIVYAAAAWILIQVIRLLLIRGRSTRVSTYDRS